MEELLKKKTAALEALKAVDAKLAALLARDDLTDDQRKEHADLKAERAKIKDRIARLDEAIADANESARLTADADVQAADARRQSQQFSDDVVRAGRLTQTDTPALGHTGGGTSVELGNLARVRDDGDGIVGTWGFRNFGDFAREAAVSVINQQRPMRIINGFQQAAEMARGMGALGAQMTATGMGEAIGPDGGFLVPPEFSRRVFERVYSESGLLSRTDIYNISTNSISFPRIDETSRVTGSRAGGVQAYWRNEGASPTATKPKVGRFTLTLNKLIALGIATDELLEDAGTALDQFLYRHFSNEINFLVSDSLVNGTGAGQPLGILNAACTVSVSKETGQSAATINATNILKMWSRLFAGSRSSCIWLINQDVEPQLYSMQIGTGVANQVVYMPPGGLSQAPYATLMGRPVVPVEYCATLGTVGDIILADLSQWATAVKSGGPRSAASMHLYFDREEQAFRVSYRLDSRPWWASALTPYKGSNTQSCAITLATRA